MVERSSSDVLAGRRAGLAYGAGAYVLWGAFPLYFPLLRPAGTVEILASRMAWSLVVMLLVLWFSGSFSRFRAVLRNWREMRWLVPAAVLITANWGTYIYGVNSGHVLEASLGYFVTPLVTILFAVLLLGERLRPAQWTAVAIGAIAVAVIAVDYGRVPWIALILAVSFATYGLCKKKADVGAVESLAVETTVLFPFAIAALAVVAAQGDLVFGTRWSTSLLIASSGVVTAVPLLLFAAGTRRLPLSVVGLLQYLAPVLQFAVGVGIRHESLPTAELVGFVLVWIALIVLTVDGLRSQRAVRQMAAAALTAP